MDNIPDYDDSQIEKDKAQQEIDISNVVESIKLENFCDMVNCDETIQQLLDNKNVKKIIKQIMIVSILIILFIVISLIYLMRKK